jgi:transcriptional regulator with XRE-family HTH domain
MSTAESTSGVEVDACDCRLEALRMIRLLRRYSLKDVADRSGLSAGYIQKLERGEIREPSPTRLRSLARALDYPYARLLALAGYLDESDGVEACLIDRSPEPDPQLASLDKRLAVLAEAIGGAALDDAEANFLAASLAQYREMRKAGAAPPADFLLSVLHEYQRLHLAGSSVSAAELSGVS